MSEGFITIFGGSGFLGTYIVQRLAGLGIPIRVAVRDPISANHLKVMGAVGQIGIVQANISNQASVDAAIAGASCVINLVGILAETSKQKFDSLHIDGAERISNSAISFEVDRLIHFSSIGADINSPSRYSRTKAKGEIKVKEIFPSATIVRPSVVFGIEDKFINRFASLLKIFPVLPIFGSKNGPNLQPIYVGDVADAVIEILSRDFSRGKIYELGGPDILTLRKIYELIISDLDRKKIILPIWNWIGIVLSIVTSILPVPFIFKITRDQLHDLKRDNVAELGRTSLSELGIHPTPLSAIIPSLLARYKS